MSIDEKMTICEMVISALHNQHNITQLIEQMSAEDQLEATRFMEFLEKSDVRIPPGL